MDMKIQTPVSQQTATTKATATRDNATGTPQAGDAKASGKAAQTFSDALRSTSDGVTNGTTAAAPNSETVTETPLNGFAAAIAAFLLPQKDGMSANQALLSALLGQASPDGTEMVPGDPEALEALAETPEGQEWLAQAAFLLGALGYLPAPVEAVDPNGTDAAVLAADSSDASLASQVLPATPVAPKLTAVLEGLAQAVQENGDHPLTGQVLEGLAKLMAGAAPDAAAGNQPPIRHKAVAAGGTGTNPAVLLAGDQDELTIVAPSPGASKTDKQQKALQMLAYRSGYSVESYASARPQSEKTQTADISQPGAEPELPHTAHALSASRESNNNTPLMERPVVTVPIREFPQVLTNLVSKNLSTNLLNGMSEARMILHPEHLGQVDVKLTLQNGQLVAHFTAQQAAGKEALENQMAQLRTNLQAQGYQVERLEVTQSPSLQSGMFQDGRQEQASRQFSGNNGERSAREQEEERFSLDAVQTEQIRQAASGATMDVTA